MSSKKPRSLRGWELAPIGASRLLQYKQQYNG